MLVSYDQNVGNFTNLVNKKMVYYLTSQLGAFDITAEQWQVLLKLSKHNNINQKILSQMTNKDQPTLTRMLDILERKALVERHVSKEDRRSFCINITEKGLALTEKLIPYIEDIFKKILNGISEKDLNIYLDVLDQINKNISNLEL
ncbi:MarR family transcriptional regulator [Clostridiaceae bacterium UIB06]|uniref:MarR family transcriptional regulator n=1 Tax=Clostridium thailandense TaxID=2794346 RepID=A0A949TU88_9CLOT|nr:MarR family transcriptional regulator [Clostridium thailandense]MBV7276587.1 MarR family transcriptional regulator [Clostridium thailandense]MCH5136124.1 MarR family transcriptional regulator [Clostridiaceae bacterium UIB06]